MFKTYRIWFAASLVCHIILLGWMSVVRLPAQQQRRPSVVRMIHLPPQPPKPLVQADPPPKPPEPPKPVTPVTPPKPVTPVTQPKPVDSRPHQSIVAPTPDKVDPTQSAKAAGRVNGNISTIDTHLNTTTTLLNPDSGASVKSQVVGPNTPDLNAGNPNAVIPVIGAKSGGPTIDSSNHPIQAVLNNLNHNQGYGGDPHPVIQGVVGAQGSRSADAGKVFVTTVSDGGGGGTGGLGAYKSAVYSAPIHAGPGQLGDDSVDASPTPVYTEIAPSEAKLMSPAAPLQAKYGRENHLRATLKLTVTISKSGIVSRLVENSLDALNGLDPTVQQDAIKTAESAVRHSIFKPKTIHGDHVDGGTVNLSVVFDGDGYAKVRRD